MRKQAKYNRGMAVRLVVMLCLFTTLVGAASPRAFAAGGFGTGKCTLTINCSYNGSGLQGMVYRIYRVADVSEKKEFTLSGDFKNYKVNMKNLDASGFSAAAYTLATYAKYDSISVLATASADSSGNICFDNLDAGLYLLAGDKMTGNSSVYRAAPVLVCLPEPQSDGTWNTAVSVTAKISATPPPGPGDTVDLSVIKVWNDSGNNIFRPVSIGVTLLRDGKAYETCTLTANSYWRKSWSGLSAASEWTVIENNVPAGYTVAYSASQTALMITNTGTPTTNIPDEPYPGAALLPQTGILWWPVPVMAVLGVLLFSMGWLQYLRSRNKSHEN